MKTFFLLPVVAWLTASAAVAQVSIAVNTVSTKAISPYIYGLNPYHYSATQTGLAVHDAGIRPTALRFGGDAVSTYNWEKNTNTSWEQTCGNNYATNSNNNYMAYASGQPSSAYGNKAGAALKLVSDAQSLGAYPLIQISAMQYAAKDANNCITSSQCGSAGVTAGRYVEIQTVKPGGVMSLTPDINDAFAYADEEVNYLANQAGTAIKGYCLENEAGIWNLTHPCNHPARATCGEILTKNISLAKRIKTLHPAADVFGPGMVNYTEYTQLNYTNAQPTPSDWNTYNMSDTTFNAASYNYVTWICSYLRQMRKASQTEGKRLLDVLDLHYYNEANNLYQDSRSFWDSSYVENSWITNDVINGNPVRLVHSVKKAISDFYPGTKIGITEWGNFDYSNNAAGIYTADLLGAFGKYDVYFASYWGILRNFTAGAYNIYRNYDGQNSAFGNTSVSSSSSNNSLVTAYASITGSNDSVVHLVLINRSSSSQTASVALTSSRTYTSAAVWAMSSTGSGAVQSGTGVSNISNNAFSYSIPARSVHHLVLRGNGSTGVGRVNAENELRLYPNPAGDVLHLERALTSSQMNRELVQILGMDGRLLQQENWQAGTKKLSIPVQNLPGGHYMVVFGSQHRIFEKK